MMSYTLLFLFTYSLVPFLTYIRFIAFQWDYGKFAWMGCMFREHRSYGGMMQLPPIDRFGSSLDVKWDIWAYASNQERQSGFKFSTVR